MEFINKLFDYSKTEEGRKKIQCSNEQLHRILQICTEVLDPVTGTMEMDLRLKSIRILRNVCCNDLDRTFFDLFSSQGLILKVVNVCRDRMLRKVSDDTDLSSTERKEESIPEVHAFVQFIANFTANGEHAVDYLVKAAGPDLIPFQDLLAVCSVCRTSKVTATVFAIFYNCFRVSDHPDSLSRLELFCSNRALLCQLMMLVMDCNSSSNNMDEVMDWLEMIGLVLVRECKVLPVFNLVGPSQSSSSSDVVVTHEQLVVLQLSLSVLDDSSLSSQLIESYQSRPTQWADLCVSLMNRLISLQTKLSIDPTTYNASNKSSDVNEVVAGIENSMQTELRRDFVIVALQMVSSMLSVLSEVEEAHQLKEALLAVNTVQHLSELIAGHHVGARISEKRNYSSSVPGTDANPWEEGVKCIVRNVLQLLGNLVYRSRAAQDTLRESGGLAVVLSHCATDFSNPLAREWALLCTRNAAEGNIANQDFIDSLRPQSVSIQDEKMKQQGMNVELNPQTGKFKFTQTPPTSGTNCAVEEKETS